MDEIGKLVRFITDNLRKNVSLIEVINHDEAPSKEQQLFNGIQKGLYSTDNEAAHALYETASTDQRYRMLKSRLRYKLYSLLYFVESNDSLEGVGANSYERECSQCLFRADVMLKEAEYDLAEKHVNKALSVANEAEFTGFILAGLKMLRIIYSELCRPNHLRKTQAQIKKYEELLRIEEEADSVFYIPKMQVQKSDHSRKVHLDAALKAVESLKQLWEKGKSFHLFEKYYKLRIDSSRLLGNYRDILTITSEVEELLKDGTVNPLRFDMRYNVHIKTYAHLRAKDYKNGLQYARTGVEYMARTSKNWFVYMENYFLMALYSENYELAEELAGQVWRNPYLEQLDWKYKEKWELYKGYLYFMMPNRDVQDAIDFNRIYSNLASYLDEEQKLVVGVMILEFVYLVRNDRLDFALEKLPRMENYIQEFLDKNTENQREMLFLKLINIMVEGSFNPEIAERKGEKYYNKLKNTADPGESFAEMEIVPYEKLWDLLLQTMEYSHVKLDFGR